MISFVSILILAPVEYANRQLDDIEQVVYKKHTYITSLETIIFFMVLLCGGKQISLYFMRVFLIMSGILLAGKCKNGLGRTSDNVHKAERKIE